VLVNDKKTGRQRVEVEHAAGWRLMMFRGQFKTRLMVEQVGATMHQWLLSLVSSGERGNIRT